MFKKFVQRIVEAQTPEDVFYGEDGIDIAFQKEKISWVEHQLLLALVNRISGGTQ